MPTNTQVRSYAENGFVLVGGLFTAGELDELEAGFDAIVRRHLAERDIDHTWGGSWRGERTDTKIVGIHDVQAFSAVWARALLHPRLAAAFSALMGSPNVQLHHTKLFQKPPERGSGFPLHQDWPYFPHERHTMMAGIIHLSDATEEMGCVTVVPGSHQLGPLATARDGLYLDPRVALPAPVASCPARRGDVLFFNYLTVHGSGPNTSSSVRKTVLVQVRDPEDLPTHAVHTGSHGQGLMMAGSNPRTDWRVPASAGGEEDLGGLLRGMWIKNGESDETST